MSISRVAFEVSVSFLGLQAGRIVCELVATLENKGVVPLRIRDFNFKLLGLPKGHEAKPGGKAIRKQLWFPDVLKEGSFVKGWVSFVYPGVKTEYNFVLSIAPETAFVRMQGDFTYLANGDTHHAAKVLAVPDFEENAGASSAGEAPDHAPVASVG
jgi:hypothetical protein